MVYPALLPLMRTPRLPVVDWTDASADLNVRFAERRNLVSACVSSHFKRSQPLRIQLCRWVSFSQRLEGTYCFHLQRMGPKRKNSCAPQLSDTASYPRTPLSEPQISRPLTFWQRRRRLEVETSEIWHCVTHSAGTEGLQWMVLPTCSSNRYQPAVSQYHVNRRITK